ncbi:serine hydrolase domain-containing protein [Devosia lacusdianchii]|uniref:serine hydrolase domain-containing protein n=1 Tax=Devosia lacusdianchii TaxID=2917991 RepID=UPI001F062F69|nr:serine hydrolase [Devosia sp. JXJ CY 41]
MRKWIIGAIPALAAGTFGVLAHAPYLPQLLIEGFPPLVFSGRGHFVEIAGAGSPRDLQVAEDAQKRDLVPELATMFADTGGQALLAYRDGKLVLEHYGAGKTSDTRFNSYSMAKSLIGALVYKAIAEGKIASLDVRLGEVLPDDRGIEGLTLRSLITMRAGIHFDTADSKLGNGNGKDSDTAPNPFGPLARLHFMGLPAIEAGLQLATAPEGDFNYQNVNTALLGEVLEVVYGRPLETLMAEKVWGPAVAQTALWRKPGETASVSAYCCIYATARDWIRIGVYLMQNGTVNAPFLPEPLWREFMGLDVDAEALAVGNYGQHILQNVLDRPGQALQGPFTYLMGQGGQMLYLMPQRGLVVYRAGDNVQLLHSTLYGVWNSLD